MAKIVLDPGHGGSTNIGGSDANHAVGPSGLKEKTATLDVARRTRDALQAKGHLVIMTRDGDNNLSLADRAAAAKSIAAPVFVSIHFNGFNKSTQGTETFCHTEHAAKSAALCRAIQKKLVAATGLSDRNASHPGGVKTQALGVLRKSRHASATACVLCEVSFMDVKAEDDRLHTDAYKDKIAAGLAQGIIDYLSQPVPESPRVKAVVEFQDGFDLLAAESPRPESVGARRKASARIADEENDREEFAKVDIKEMLADEAAPQGLTAEAPGIDMAAFEAFVGSLGLRHFSAGELLFMGGSNQPGMSCAGKNSPPPMALWVNIANTARMLDEIRHRLGAACRILSAYRSPAYNDCVGGEDNSLHMRFNAIDFTCASGTPAQWRAVAQAVRSSNPSYRGGIGMYVSKRFIHIDTRGSEANWQKP